MPDDSDETDALMIVPHPVSPLLPGCPLAHLYAYHLSSQTFHAVKRGLARGAMVGDLLKYYRSGTLTRIRGVGEVRAAELRRVLAVGLVPGDGPLHVPLGLPDD